MNNIGLARPHWRCHGGRVTEHDRYNVPWLGHKYPDRKDGMTSPHPPGPFHLGLTQPLYFKPFKPRLFHGEAEQLF